MNSNDHDVLIGIGKDVSHMVEWTKIHSADDEQKHRDNLGKFDKIDASIDELKKFKWQSMAVVGIVLIIIDLLAKKFF